MRAAPDSAQVPEVTGPRRAHAARVGTWTWKAAIVLAISVGGVWVATHGVAGVAWSEVVAVIAGVTLGRLALLAAIWAGGLVIYSTVLAGSLPGLGMRRGLLMNLTGSAVSNLMPLGGAAGTALNWRMARTWGHSHKAFASYFVLTNALDVLTKLLLPPVALAALVTVSIYVPTTVRAMVGGCVLVLALAALAHLWSRSRSRHAPRSRRPGWWTSLSTQVEDVAGRVRTQLGRHWTRLLPASIGYIAAQVLLLSASLQAVGVAAPLAIVLMAAAIERMASLIPLTPAGTGVAELGTIAWLVANGLDPVGVVAGVLLYRLFMVAVEVPVGGLLLTGWAWWHRGSLVPDDADLGPADLKVAA